MKDDTLYLLLGLGAIGVGVWWFSFREPQSTAQADVRTPLYAGGPPPHIPPSTIPPQPTPTYGSTGMSTQDKLIGAAAAGACAFYTGANPLCGLAPPVAVGLKNVSVKGVKAAWDGVKSLF